MIALIQRVSQAGVAVDGDTVAAIGPGLVALVAARVDDNEARADRLAERLLAYRIFADARGRMNHSVVQAGGALLIVPQFTLAADTRRGNRPGFSDACPPERAKPLYERLICTLAARHAAVERGIFGAHMQVSLVNDGPATFWLNS